MRTKVITIGGKEYVMVRNLQAVIDIDELPKTISPLRRTLKTIEILLNAGYAWAKKQGKDALVPPTFDQLSEDYDIDDLQEWNNSINDVMSEDERNVEAKPPKKDEAGA